MPWLQEQTGRHRSFPVSTPLGPPQLRFLNVLIASFLCHHFLFFASGADPHTARPRGTLGAGDLGDGSLHSAIYQRVTFTPAMPFDFAGKQELQALGQGRAESEMTQAA